MRTTLLIILLLMITGVGHTAETLDEANALFARANQAYEDEQFAEALTMYEELMAGEYGTGDVLANAGTAAWRTEDIGKAVLYYLRALKIEPGNERARENLAFVQPGTNVVEEESFFTLLRAWFAATSAWPWYVLFQISFVLLITGLVFAARTQPGTDSRIEWLGRSGGGVAASLVMGLIVFLHAEARQPQGDGVVVQDKAISRSGPALNYFEQLEIPAGTIIAFKSAPRNGWVEFRLRDGSTGFLPSDVVEAI